MPELNTVIRSPWTRVSAWTSVALTSFAFCTLVEYSGHSSYCLAFALSAVYALGTRALYLPAVVSMAAWLSSIVVAPIHETHFEHVTYTMRKYATPSTAGNTLQATAIGDACGELVKEGIRAEVVGMHLDRKCVVRTRMCPVSLRSNLRPCFPGLVELHTDGRILYGEDE